MAEPGSAVASRRHSPHLGTISTMSSYAGAYGGGSDQMEGQGSQVYLPVLVEDALVFFGDSHAAIGDGIITGTGIECSMNVRARINLLKTCPLERPIIAQGGAVFFVAIGPSIEEATEDASRRAIDFMVARTGLGREEAYMLLSIVGELRVGTSPRPVMATRLIVPEEPLRAAGWNGELP
jgi:acetamidase/formamidase